MTDSTHFGSEAIRTDRDGPVPLDSVLCTEELQRRPSRSPDYKKENQALVKLAQALADSPRTILQVLADTMLDVFEAGSTGISLLTKEYGGKRFYWPAIAGKWKPHIGGGTPRDFGPCGDVLDRNSTLLFGRLEQRYTYFQPVTPNVQEALLAPFYLAGVAVGTIWAVSHDQQRKFDAEDERLMKSLGQFASSAYQTLESLDALAVQAAESKKAERAAGLLAAIVDSSDDVIISKNLDGVITSWNNSAERVFGYQAIEAVGKSINLIIPPDHQDEEKQIIESLRRGERVDHFETLRRAKDGTLVDISVTISPIRDSAGNVIGASKVARTIGGHKRAERALAEQARLLDLTNDAIFVRQLSGKIQYWNKGASELYGYSREEATGSRSHDLLRTVFPEPLDRIMEQLLRKERWSGELIHTRKDGRQIVVSSRWALDRDAAGNPQNILETNNDITSQKQNETALRDRDEQLRALAESLENKVRQRTQELEERNQHISQLSMRLLRTQDDERRHIARELHDTAGQALTVVAMKLDRLVQESKQEAPPLSKNAETIKGLVQQISQDIRTTSYLLHPRLLDETGLSAALTWYVRGLAERTDIDIKLSVSEKLERLPQDMEVVIFRLVQECLTNIHRHSGSKTASIRIAREGREVSITIRDQGKGIPAKRLAEIQTYVAGVGIRGMRERVSQLNGEMKIESDGGGTTIVFLFPLREPSLGRKREPERPHKASRG